MRLQLFTFLAGNKTFIKVLCIWGGRSDNRGVWKRTANGWVGIKGLREHIERGIWDSARTLFSIFMWLCSFPSLACPAREIRFRLPLIIGTLWGQAFLYQSMGIDETNTFQLNFSFFFWHEYCGRNRCGLWALWACHIRVKHFRCVQGYGM